MAASNRSIARVVCAVGSILAAATALQAQDNTETRLTLGNGINWKFLGGQWTETDGEIWPPNKLDLHRRAFHVARAYDDVTVEFEYYPTSREQGSGDAGLILRAGDGYQRYVKLAWVPNVGADAGQPLLAQRIRVTPEGTFSID